MQGESLACDGIVDVGLVVLSHFSNPAKTEALNFLTKVFMQEIKAVIPTTTFLGAYHVMTSYLRLPRPEIAKILSKTLSLDSEAFYENVRKEDVREGLNYSLAYSIESWDSFLLAWAKGWARLLFFNRRKAEGKKQGFPNSQSYPERDNEEIPFLHLKDIIRVN